MRRFNLVCGLVTAATAISYGTAAMAATVFATDFNGATAGTVGSVSTINSGGSTTDDVNVRSNTGSAVALVDRGGGNLAMQFTDNSTDGVLVNNPRAYSNTFTPLSTNATGNNRLHGSFDYTRLVSTTGNSLPAFVFLASAGGVLSIDATKNAIKLSVESDGEIHYTTGSPVVGNDSNVLLATGTEYHFEIDTDFSSTGVGAQDRWSLKVTPVGSSTPVLNTGWINTFAADVQVNVISLLGGANQNAANASPFAQIDNLNFSADPVPEPAAMTALLGASAVLLRRRR